MISTLMLLLLVASVSCMDVSVLLSFKRGLQGNALISWNASRQLESWEGVNWTRRNGIDVVSELRLRNHGLSGTLSPFWCNLTNPIVIDLYGNELVGSPLSTDSCSSTSLEVLDLRLNLLGGELHGSLGNFTSLMELRLSHNSFSGSMPHNLRFLPRLTYLSGGSNNLTTALNGFRNGGFPALQELYLYENGITGVLPDALFNCTELKILDLSDNKLSGSIPASISNCTELKNLYLSGNILPGSIPASLFNCTELKNLDLSYNKLSGSIPASITRCNKLEIFYASDNMLTKIQDNITGLPALQILTLYTNSLSGTLPASYSQQLVLLDLSNNSFTGSIPTEMAAMAPSIQVLDLSENKLSGTIPTWLGNCNQLVTLYLDDNNFHGTIPVELGNLTALQSPLARSGLNCTNELCRSYFSEIAGSIDLSLNNLTGIIPEQLGNLHGHLSENKLIGKIPASLGNATSLEVLFLLGNSLTGEIPVLSMPALRIAGLAYNRLSGTLPTAYSEKLVDLDLCSNMFTGTIPDCMAALAPRIQYLNVGNNRLEGPIPSWFGNFTQLLYFYLADNNLQGTVPGQLGNLRALQSPVRASHILNTSGCYTESDCSTNFVDDDRGTVVSNSFISLKTIVDLSFNKLTGSIPEELGKLQGLQVLYLNNNNLSGNIPSSLGEVKLMEVLLLQNNKLSGTIPMELGQLNFLDVLNLSSNALSGPIPSGSQLRTFNNESFLDNPGLCGEQISKPCPSIATTTTTTIPDAQDSSLALPIAIGVTLGLPAGLWAGLLLPFYIVFFIKCFVCDSVLNTN